MKENSKRFLSQTEVLEEMKNFFRNELHNSLYDIIFKLDKLCDSLLVFSPKLYDSASFIELKTLIYKVREDTLRLSERYDKIKDILYEDINDIQKRIS